MRRSPNPWPIGLREPNPAGVRETRAVAVMVGHSEEVGSGYANAGGERYLVISVAAIGAPPLSEYAVYLANHDARTALTCLECGACTDWTR
jgi:hypothetical protein